MHGSMLNVYVYLQLEGVYHEPIRKSIEDIQIALGRSKPTVLEAIKGLVDIDFITYNPTKSQYSLCEFTIIKRNGEDSTGKKTLPMKPRGSKEILPVEGFTGKEILPPTLPVTSENPHQSTLLTPPKKVLKKYYKNKRTLHSETVKSTGKEILPVNQPKPLTPIQQIVEAYKTIKGFQNIANWNEVHFTGHVKAAKKLLLLADGNYELAIAGMKAIGKVLDDRGMSTWGLDGIVRQFPQYLVEKKREEGA